MYHAEVMKQVELIIVDNSPDSEDGKLVKDFLGWIKGDIHSVRYVSSPENIGTAAPRDRIFREATAPLVLCMDCHVLLEPDSLQKLLAYYKQHPNTPDLLSGPLIYDDLRNLATHFEDQWRGEMWGTWATDPRGDPHSSVYDGEPFEIPANGLGLFSCRKDKWLGFNPEFRGFGGEEFYIHTKYRQAGAKCLCLPWLRWLHRFGRPGGVKYPLQRWDKVRNYVIGHKELGLPLDRIKEHFVNSGLLPIKDWEDILSGAKSPISRLEKKCGSCGQQPQIPIPFDTLEKWYNFALKTPHDINEHCPTLRRLAEKCSKVTEWGKRHEVSSVALLAGLSNSGKLTSYNVGKFSQVDALTKISGGRFEFKEGDSLEANIEDTDLLFIDTIHTAERIYAELKRHASKVSKYIVLHDTEAFGEVAPGGGPGLLVGLRKFLFEFPEWTVIEIYHNNYGLTVLSKLEEDKTQPPGKLRQALNFTKALTEHAKDGMKLVSDDVWKERLNKCSICPHRYVSSCGLCGCPIDKKASWSSSSCPDSPPRWEKVVDGV